MTQYPRLRTRRPTPKAVAIAKAAVKTGQAAWLLANAASISEADAAKCEAAGLKADEVFDAYARDHPD